jgi:hypothetical protein
MTRSTLCDSCSEIIPENSGDAVHVVVTRRHFDRTSYDFCDEYCSADFIAKTMTKRPKLKVKRI